MKTRTFIDKKNGMVYRYAGKTNEVTAISPDGDEVRESLSGSLIERLEAQGVPVEALCRGPHFFRLIRLHPHDCY